MNKFARYDPENKVFKDHQDKVLENAQSVTWDADANWVLSVVNEQLAAHGLTVTVYGHKQEEWAVIIHVDKLEESQEEN